MKSLNGAAAVAAWGALLAGGTRRQSRRRRVATLNSMPRLRCIAFMIVLAVVGPGTPATSQVCSSDLTGDGLVDGADLATLLGSWGPCPAPVATRFIGVVVRDSGEVVPSAIVASDYGGVAVSQTNGQFDLEIALDASVATVELTAAASIDGTVLQGRTTISTIDLGQPNVVGAIVVDACAGDRQWSPMGPGVDGKVYSTVVYDDGSGPSVYAAGLFVQAGSETVNYIAKWDGASWTPLAGGMNDWVYDLYVFNDGGGPALFAAGKFTMAGGVEANRIARWDGKAWSPLGAGMNGLVHSMCAFDDGDGISLYASGNFTQAGGAAATRVAKWDGSAWSSLPGGPNAIVFTSVVFGNALYVGGNFTAIGGVAASRIAKWDGEAWSPVGGGGRREWSTTIRGRNLR